MSTPVNPSFTILKWGVRGYKSHGPNILIYLEKFLSQLISPIFSVL